MESACNLGLLLLVVTYNNENAYEVVIHLAVMINGLRVFFRFLFPSGSFIITAKYEYILVSVCLFWFWGYNRLKSSHPLLKISLRVNFNGLWLFMWLCWLDQMSRGHGQGWGVHTSHHHSDACVYGTPLTSRTLPFDPWPVSHYWTFFSGKHDVQLFVYSGQGVCGEGRHPF